MTLSVGCGGGEYPVVIGRGERHRAAEVFALDRKVLVVTDDGVPASYVKEAVSAAAEPTLVVLPAGEKTKSFRALERLLSVMLSAEFSRTDAVLAVGGGVVGDLAGLAAAMYMRGIDFYNLPTTLLAQADSSIGGKTAIDLCGVKNAVGAFYPPKAVLIDPEVLDTLPEEQFRCGLAEIIKMAATSDAALFEKLEGMTCEEIRADMEEILFRALSIKARIVGADEREGGIRRMLNFGHTVGHAIESAGSYTKTHGECVAQGMLYFSDGEARARLEALLRRLKFDTVCRIPAEKLGKYLRLDKKKSGDGIYTVEVTEIGKGRIVRRTLAEAEEKIREERA